ncbi:uncharacterized protein FIBRA_02191 [Fibroporia radiculosa]|uniref:Asteroid domain-containing protein n=1 Tax=Fibroporia radiculosa TaxID=599839 RepID=J4G1E5_9APHY|nr:uncharacterized protein FIBRA_02191 [Fibroporia radiculosa]CCM00163.1 predicted protein [Fibroporia radiculosa]
MLPPLAYSVCVRTLLDLSRAMNDNVVVHFADGEGDPCAVSLAGRLHAYVVGRDSDFVILNAEGYRGYIPLDEMLWNSVASSSTASDAGSVYSSVYGDVEDDVDANGFKTVRKSKIRKRSAVNQRVGRGLIPPDHLVDSDTDLVLTATVYSPESLAAHLQLPTSLLPLLGALVGNDFTGAPEVTSIDAYNSSKKNDLQQLFFEKQLTLTQRITKVANTLRSLLNAAFPTTSTTHQRRKNKPIRSVIELIQAAISAMLRFPDNLAAVEREAIADRIAEATLQYAIPRFDVPGDDADGDENRPRGLKWMSDVCPLHPRDSCPLFTTLMHSVVDATSVYPGNESLSSNGNIVTEADEMESPRDPHACLAASYIAAYRAGDLSSDMLDALYTGTSWPLLFLENPDKETVARSIGRPIREICYSILDGGIGLMRSSDVDEAEEDEDDDELIDVVEEDDEDLLAPLRGALERFDHPPETAEGEAGDLHSTQPENRSPATKSQRPKIILEYVRRGTRLAAEEVTVPFLRDVVISINNPSLCDDIGNNHTPVPLWSETLRMTFFLRVLKSDVPSVAALVGTPHLMASLAIRWTVMQLHARAEESEEQKEKAMERWTISEARALVEAFSWNASEDSDTQEQSRLQENILERNIQLTAQFLMALDTIEQFAQIMLLTAQVPSPAAHFSGRRFHANLNSRGATRHISPDVGDGLWRACMEDLKDVYAEDKRAKTRKERKKERGPTSTPSKNEKKNNQPRGGMYGMLAGLEV